MRRLIILLFLLMASCSIPHKVPEAPKDASLAKATFAGGCFWCMEPPFEKLPGVKAVISGYAGGEEENPSYKEVSSGKTGHVEAVQIYFDPAVIDYSELLNVFWHNVDPTDAGGQFVDRGPQYVTAVFYHDENQKLLAEASRDAIQNYFDEPVVTRIEQFTSFYPAEEYHQDYYKKSAVQYKFYRSRSGRDEFLEETWRDEMTYKNPSDEELRKILTSLQYKVLREDGTEPAFDNEYWDNHEEGIYVDRITGEPLFSSKDKYDSGTGWPSFTKPLEPDNMVYKEDNTLLQKRTEVRSKHGDNHLGHVFDDGPAPTGKRYCMNSAALRFIPKGQLVKEGYGKYAEMFE